MNRYQLFHTQFCPRCIKGAIADDEDIAAILSDPHNNCEKRRHILELVRELRRLKEEHERMGLYDSPLNVMDT